MAERNSEIPETNRIVFRIGINLGDVIVENDDIFGDGVNVAARLQALAKPGGIFISRSARDQVRDKLDLTLEDLANKRSRTSLVRSEYFQSPLTPARAEGLPPHTVR